MGNEKKIDYVEKLNEAIKDRSIYLYKDVIQLYVDAIKKEGGDINQLDENDKAPIHYAVERGDSDILKYLIENGANVNLKGSYDLKGLVLHFLVFTTHDVNHKATIAKILIFNGANPNLLDAQGNKPIVYLNNKEEKALFNVLDKASKDREINKNSEEVLNADLRSKTMRTKPMQNPYLHDVEVCGLGALNIGNDDL